MVGRGADLSKDIYDIANEINNKLSEQYNGDELYQKAVELVREHGYSLEKENIRETLPDSNYHNLELEQEHAEIISEFRDGNSVYRLRIILDYGDSRLEERNRAELVGTLEDFTDISNFLEPSE